MNMDKEDNSYKKKQHGIEVEAKDPIYDVLSDEEIDEASERLESLLEDSEDS